MRIPKEQERGAPKTLFVHKNDQVVILSGKDTDKRGKVLEALPRKGKVIVEGVNVVKRHQKPRGGPAMQQQAGIIEKPAPIPSSKVMVICPTCEKPSRVQYRFIDVAGKHTKVRWCPACDNPIDQK